MLLVILPPLPCNTAAEFINSPTEKGQNES